MISTTTRVHMMNEGQAALAHAHALSICLQAVIQGLPPDGAAASLEALRQLAPYVEAISNGTSKLPDEALELQKSAIEAIIKLLEQRAAKTQ